MESWSKIDSSIRSELNLDFSSTTETLTQQKMSLVPLNQTQINTD